jgi:hypothetical protein
MTERIGKEAVTELARAVVTSLAPAEIPLFGAMSRAFFDDPSRAKPKRVGKDETLGFGVGEAVTLVTPVVLAATTHIGAFMIDEIGKILTTATEEYVTEQVKRLFRREHSGVKLDSAQLAQVRVIALNTAQQFRLSKAKAALLADVLVGHLAAGGSC